MDILSVCKTELNIVSVISRELSTVIKMLNDRVNIGTEIRYVQYLCNFCIIHFGAPLSE